MDTGSLVDLVTSVDIGSLGPAYQQVGALIASLFDVVGDLIGLWPAGSAGAAGSLQGIVGSVSGT
ncbi:hypothetical protein [Prescottella equi]|jgi:hypothetical protein|uniref:Uncharacterized protein n=1 Tax=Rhodococcus hoagii TaxID=43767 RepID=A0AAE2WCI0_RHOHA|nr:hypothetical protein [Prescottella equi]GBF16197.1 hypothetical protein Br6_03590 [Rhodococcus sp. Br-6]MBM4472482.1 hypothetical protein [Prescottella equi]MBM4474791.1 hypothetical protein [Prescottella equi]MBM4486153.1 hypothetical protein [Prescottella equi]MBM4493478.1 hypothetical protein [Prescottella equi]